MHKTRESNADDRERLCAAGDLPFGNGQGRARRDDHMTFGGQGRNSNNISETKYCRSSRPPSNHRDRPGVSFATYTGWKSYLDGRNRGAKSGESSVKGFSSRDKERDRDSAKASRRDRARLNRRDHSFNRRHFYQENQTPRAEGIVQTTSGAARHAVEDSDSCGSLASVRSLPAGGLGSVVNRGVLRGKPPDHPVLLRSYTDATDCGYIDASVKSYLHGRLGYGATERLNAGNSLSSLARSIFGGAGFMGTNCNGSNGVGGLKSAGLLGVGVGENFMSSTISSTSNVSNNGSRNNNGSSSSNNIINNNNNNNNNNLFDGGYRRTKIKNGTIYNCSQNNCTLQVGKYSAGESEKCITTDVVNVPDEYAIVGKANGIGQFCKSNNTKVTSRTSIRGLKTKTRGRPSHFKTASEKTYRKEFYVNCKNITETHQGAASSKASRDTSNSIHHGGSWGIAAKRDLYLSSRPETTYSSEPGGSKGSEAVRSWQRNVPRVYSNIVCDTIAYQNSNNNSSSSNSSSMCTTSCSPPAVSAPFSRQNLSSVFSTETSTSNTASSEEVDASLCSTDLDVYPVCPRRSLFSASTTTETCSTSSSLTHSFCPTCETDGTTSTSDSCTRSLTTESVQNTSNSHLQKNPSIRLVLPDHKGNTLRDSGEEVSGPNSLPRKRRQLSLRRHGRRDSATNATKKQKEAGKGKSKEENSCTKKPQKPMAAKRKTASQGKIVQSVGKLCPPMAKALKQKQNDPDNQDAQQTAVRPPNLKGKYFAQVTKPQTAVPYIRAVSAPLPKKVSESRQCDPAMFSKAKERVNTIKAANLITPINDMVKPVILKGPSASTLAKVMRASSPAPAAEDALQLQATSLNVAVVKRPRSTIPIQVVCESPPLKTRRTTSLTRSKGCSASLETEHVTKPQALHLNEDAPVESKRKKLERALCEFSDKRVDGVGKRSTAPINNRSHSMSIQSRPRSPLVVKRHETFTGELSIQTIRSGWAHEREMDQMTSSCQIGPQTTKYLENTGEVRLEKDFVDTTERLENLEISDQSEDQKPTTYERVKLLRQKDRIHIFSSEEPHPKKNKRSHLVDTDIKNTSSDPESATGRRSAPLRGIHRRRSMDLPARRGTSVKPGRARDGVRRCAVSLKDQIWRQETPQSRADGEVQRAMQRSAVPGQGTHSASSLLAGKPEADDKTERWVVEHMPLVETNKRKMKHSKINVKRRARTRPSISGRHICSRRTRRSHSARRSYLSSSVSQISGDSFGETLFKFKRPSSINAVQTNQQNTSDLSPCGFREKMQHVQEQKCLHPAKANCHQRPPGLSDERVTEEISAPTVEVIYNAPKPLQALSGAQTGGRTTPTLVKKAVLDCLYQGPPASSSDKHYAYKREEGSWLAALSTPKDASSRCITGNTKGKESLKSRRGSVKAKFNSASREPFTAVATKRGKAIKASPRTRSYSPKVCLRPEKEQRDKRDSMKRDPAAPACKTMGQKNTQNGKENCKDAQQRQSSLRRPSKLPVPRRPNQSPIHWLKRDVKNSVERSPSTDKRDLDSPRLPYQANERQQQQQQKLLEKTEKQQQPKRQMLEQQNEDKEKRQASEDQGVHLECDDSTLHTTHTSVKGDNSGTAYSALSYAAAVLDSSWPPARSLHVDPREKDPTPWTSANGSMSKFKFKYRRGQSVSHRIGACTPGTCFKLETRDQLSATRSIPDLTEGRSIENTKHRCSMIRQYIQDKYACLRHTSVPCRRIAPATDYKKKLDELLSSYFQIEMQNAVGNDDTKIESGGTVKDVDTAMASRPAIDIKSSIDPPDLEVNEAVSENMEKGTATIEKERDDNAISDAATECTEQKRSDCNNAVGVNRQEPCWRKRAYKPPRAPPTLSISAYDSLITELKSHYLLERLVNQSCEQSAVDEEEEDQDQDSSGDWEDKTDDDKTFTVFTECDGEAFGDEAWGRSIVGMGDNPPAAAGQSQASPGGRGFESQAKQTDPLGSRDSPQKVHSTPVKTGLASKCGGFKTQCANVAGGCDKNNGLFDLAHVQKCIDTSVKPAQNITPCQRVRERVLESRYQPDNIVSSPTDKEVEDTILVKEQSGDRVETGGQIDTRDQNLENKLQSIFKEAKVEIIKRRLDEGESDIQVNKELNGKDKQKIPVLFDNCIQNMDKNSYTSNSTTYKKAVSKQSSAPGLHNGVHKDEIPGSSRTNDSTKMRCSNEEPEGTISSSQILASSTAGKCTKETGAKTGVSEAQRANCKRAGDWSNQVTNSSKVEVVSSVSEIDGDRRLPLKSAHPKTNQDQFETTNITDNSTLSESNGASKESSARLPTSDKKNCVLYEHHRCQKQETLDKRNYHLFEHRGSQEQESTLNATDDVVKNFNNVSCRPSGLTDDAASRPETLTQVTASPLSVANADYTSASLSYGECASGTSDTLKTSMVPEQRYLPPAPLTTSVDLSPNSSHISAGSVSMRGSCVNNVGTQSDEVLSFSDPDTGTGDRIQNSCRMRDSEQYCDAPQSEPLDLSVKGKTPRMQYSRGEVLSEHDAKHEFLQEHLCQSHNDFDAKFPFQKQYGVFSLPKDQAEITSPFLEATNALSDKCRKNEYTSVSVMRNDKESTNSVSISHERVHNNQCDKQCDNLHRGKHLDNEDDYSFETFMRKASADEACASPYQPDPSSSSSERIGLKGSSKPLGNFIGDNLTDIYWELISRRMCETVLYNSMLKCWDINLSREIGSYLMGEHCKPQEPSNFQLPQMNEHCNPQESNDVQMLEVSEHCTSQKSKYNQPLEMAERRNLKEPNDIQLRGIADHCKSQESNNVQHCESAISLYREKFKKRRAERKKHVSDAANTCRSPLSCGSDGTDSARPFVRPENHRVRICSLPKSDHPSTPDTEPSRCGHDISARQGLRPAADKPAGTALGDSPCSRLAPAVSSRANSTGTSLTPSRENPNKRGDYCPGEIRSCDRAESGETTSSSSVNSLSAHVCDAVPSKEPCATMSRASHISVTSEGSFHSCCSVCDFNPPRHSNGQSPSRERQQVQSKSS